MSTYRAWAMVDLDTIKLPAISDDLSIEDDLEEWIEHLGSSIAYSIGEPGKKITIDIETVLAQWVAGGFAEHPAEYRITEKGRLLEHPPATPVMIYGSGLTAPWSTARMGPLPTNYLPGLSDPLEAGRA